MTNKVFQRIIASKLQNTEVDPFALCRLMTVLQLMTQHIYPSLYKIYLSEDPKTLKTCQSNPKCHSAAETQRPLPRRTLSLRTQLMTFNSLTITLTLLKFHLD